MRPYILKIFLLSLVFALLVTGFFYQRYFRDVQFVESASLSVNEPVSKSFAEDLSWISLFDGLSLAGWKVKISGEPLGSDRRQTFRALNGVISVSYENYEGWDDAFGHLFYNTRFSSYILQLEYRFQGHQLLAARSLEWAWRNSGVMIHAQPPEDMTINQGFPVSLEVQLLGAKEGVHRSTGNLCSPGTHIRLRNILVSQHCVKSSSHSFSNDEWTHLEVEVLGGRTIRHFINGDLVLHYSSPVLDLWSADSRRIRDKQNGQVEVASGYIALQSESHPIEFKNIKLINLEHLKISDLSEGNRYLVK